MKVAIPKTEFDPHPAGQHQGTITEVIDQGLQVGRFGTKPKLTIIITSGTATKPNGEPAELWIWCTVSAGRKATLTRHREKLLGRQLTETERLHFDPDREMIGRQVTYIVEHNFGDAGQTFANLTTLAPVGQGQAAQVAREAIQAPPAPAPAPNGQQPGVMVADVHSDRTEIVQPAFMNSPPAAGNSNDVPF